MELTVPRNIAASCVEVPEWTAWLEQLPDTVCDLQRRWALTVGEPYDSPEVNCAWVAPATLNDGTAAVLKIGMPHMEAEHEIPGLRFWDGDPTVRLIRGDDSLGAMLLERCEPGTTLRELPEPEQDSVIAGLLQRLWRTPSKPHPFRPLADMLTLWSEETRRDATRWPDEGIVLEGLSLFSELPSSSPAEVMLATDLHAGNVLRAQREPWLVIDPKPFVGDPAYDATQHLFNCPARLRADSDGTIRRFADLLGVHHERVRLWAFARAAAAPRDSWLDDQWFTIARAIVP